jgi:uncharacterized protein YecE (DUF72 family)
VIRVGPAGWAYPDSPGKVYPAAAPKRFDVLAFTARWFDAIEINATFYHPQPPRTCASWARRVADRPDFRFTAKLWQRFTHGTTGRPAMGGAHAAADWTADEVRLATEGLAVLRDEGRLGAVLAQFPWSFRPSAEGRTVLERLAEDFAGWPLVVELRHGAWAERDHALLLKRLGLGFCNIDQPVIGESLGPTAGVTSTIGYVRFHGRRYDQWFEAHEDAAARYDYLYPADELRPWVERIRKVGAASGVTDVYVVSNNHFEGKGPANALMIRSMLEGRKVPCPPVLYETYRQVLEPFAEPA